MILSRNQERRDFPQNRQKSGGNNSSRLGYMDRVFVAVFSFIQLKIFCFGMDALVCGFDVKSLERNSCLRS